jgi:hypothetical protein
MHELGIQRVNRIHFFFLFFFLLPPFGVYGSSFLAPIGAAFASSFAGSASALAF